MLLLLVRGSFEAAFADVSPAVLRDRFDRGHFTLCSNATSSACRCVPVFRKIALS
jgi:hypothetical protein